ncbi:MAG: DinB family protein [bacterium]|nr:MAG: DinB family protein [bacterium]
MVLSDLSFQILDTWRPQNGILLYLINEIPDAGLATLPSHSRGRDVARQITHLYRNRLGWIHFHETGKRPRLERFDKGDPPEKARLIQFIEESGDAVEQFLERALSVQVKIRSFGKNIIRWLGYLISHESHHRGQIMLALKQNDLRLPDRVEVQGWWGK